MTYKVYIYIFPNGKRFVTEKNIKKWRNDKNQKIAYRAALKYGLKNIKQIDYDVYTEFEMNELKQHWIDYYGTEDPRYGYNVSNGKQKELLGTPQFLVDEARWLS